MPPDTFKYTVWIQPRRGRPIWVYKTNSKKDARREEKVWRGIANVTDGISDVRPFKRVFITELRNRRSK